VRKARVGSDLVGPHPGSSPRSVRFRREIGRTPRRDRSYSASRSVRCC